MFSKLLRVVIVTICLGKALAECQLKGVNIAGFDFGCETNGSCTRLTTPPFLSPGKWNLPHITKYQYYSDGIGQMQHFSKANGLNVFRLPVSWQFLLAHTLGAELDVNAFGLYNDLVQGCLKTGSYCIVDIHNYARWEGSTNIVGQGGPSNDEFADVWRQVATKYKNEPRIIFGLMNEPHDLDMQKWSDTLQHVVNVIRQAGAKSQTIFLPGTKYQSAENFGTISGPTLSQVKNPDGSNHNLVFEVHRYFAQKNQPFNGVCAYDHIEDTFAPLADYLKKNNRQAFIGELGGGPKDGNCMTHICNALEYVNQNSDVFLGYTGWSAGAFLPKYPYVLTPNGSAQAGWVDQPLLINCIAKNYGTGKTKRAEKKRAAVLLG